MVESSPLLTAEQEMSYGKAMRMFMQVEQIREHVNKINNNSTETTEPVTDIQLASIIGCPIKVLQNMSRYAVVSQNRLINCNLRLVLAVVSRYRSAGISNAEVFVSLNISI